MRFLLQCRLDLLHPLGFRLRFLSEGARFPQSILHLAVLGLIDGAEKSISFLQRFLFVLESQLGVKTLCFNVHYEIFLKFKKVNRKMSRKQTMQALKELSMIFIVMIEREKKVT